MIIQNDIGNKYSPTVIVAAVTSKQEKTKLPTHIELNVQTNGLSKESTVLLEQIRTLDKSRLKKYIGCTSQTEMKLISSALEVSLAINTDKKKVMNCA